MHTSVVKKKKFIIGLGDVYQIGDVYSETLWWMMTSGGGVRGVPKVWNPYAEPYENK